MCSVTDRRQRVQPRRPSLTIKEHSWPSSAFDSARAYVFDELWARCEMGAVVASLDPWGAKMASAQGR
jgi:hypothetical protein